MKGLTTVRTRRVEAGAPIRSHRLLVGAMISTVALVATLLAATAAPAHAGGIARSCLFKQTFTPTMPPGSLGIVEMSLIDNFGLTACYDSRYVWTVPEGFVIEALPSCRGTFFRPIVNGSRTATCEAIDGFGGVVAPIATPRKHSAMVRATGQLPTGSHQGDLCECGLPLGRGGGEYHWHLPFTIVVP